MLGRRRECKGSVAAAAAAAAAPAGVCEVDRRGLGKARGVALRLETEHNALAGQRKAGKDKSPDRVVLPPLGVLPGKRAFANSQREREGALDIDGLVAGRNGSNNISAAALEVERCLL